MQIHNPQSIAKHLDLLRNNEECETSRVRDVPLLLPDDLRIKETEDNESLPAQYGLLARALRPARRSSCDDIDEKDRLFFNTTVPSSTFICGAQGSGKSHTLSCLLENCVHESDAAVLPKPLTTLVFHYDTFISDDGGSPCEAAYLSSLPGVKVRVLCSPTNIRTIKVRVVFRRQSKEYRCR